MPNTNSYTYLEHGSKNNAGGLCQLNLENKTVTTIALPSQRPKCLVYLLDLYISKLPEFAFKQEIFYCRKHFKKNGTSHGKNKLALIIAEMCEEAVISRRTNHLLRSTGATALFQSNIPESVILKTTGHRSEKALCFYEKVSMEQTEVVSKIMMGSKQNNAQFTEESEEDKKNMAPKQLTELSSIFGGLSGCNISNITVNVSKQ